MDEIVVVKQDPRVGLYEFYLQKVHRLGTATVVGSKKVQAEDGECFQNLDDCGEHLAARAGFELSRAGSRIGVPGQEILAAGVWYDFCRDRGLNPGDVEQLHAVHEMTAAETRKYRLPGR